MGIDHIFIDESHQFKNLTFNTRHDRVAGLDVYKRQGDLNRMLNYGKSDLVRVSPNFGGEAFELDARPVSYTHLPRSGIN